MGIIRVFPVICASAARMSERQVLSEREISTDEAHSRLQVFLRKKSRDMASTMDPATFERLRRMTEQMGLQLGKTDNT